MKQKHINLLRAAANLMQSSQIQDENIQDLKKQLNQELHKKNIERVDVLNEMIQYAHKRNIQFLNQYADTIKQIAENDFTALLQGIVDDAEINENPVYENYLNKIQATA